ncbi:MAG: 50S ribosomal protein L22 [Chlamydiales bacterium]|jgi:large subunit ribosomal protein L22|nr:50S ribosomal protein L22 [Chlamydiales bacterium]
MPQRAYAKTRCALVSPRKARLAANLIRGLKVEEAVMQLRFCKLKAGLLLQKTLKSAVANAETQLHVQRCDLVVKEVRVDAGPVLKRAKPKNRGGSHPIMKRTSHFTIAVVAE